MKTNFKSAILAALALAITAGIAAQSTKRKGVKAVDHNPTVIEANRQTERFDTISDIGVINATVAVTDFSKTVASRVESMMISNHSAVDTVRAVTVDIDYKTTGGRQLNRRTVTFKAVVPPGETRHASVQSWDRQQLFYHTATPPARPTERTTAFNTTITPLRIIVARPLSDAQ